MSTEPKDFSKYGINAGLAEFLDNKGENIEEFAIITEDKRKEKFKDVPEYEAKRAEFKWMYDQPMNLKNPEDTLAVPAEEKQASSGKGEDSQ